MRKVPFLVAACVGIAFLSCWQSRAVLAQDHEKPAVAPKSHAKQRYIIKENIKDMTLQKSPSNAPETIDDVVPQNIKLYSLPSVAAKKVAQARSHLLFVKEGSQAIVLVSPEDRRVVDVI